MKDIWKQIEAWLEQNAPDLLADLKPGALEATINQTERMLSCVLPGEMVMSYRIHDGSSGGAPPLFGEWALLPLSDVVKEWNILKKRSDDGAFEGIEAEADIQIQSEWWSTCWIPVASNSSGDFLCVDLNPPRTGNHGQIICFFHADPRRKLIAKHFKDWLAGFADDLGAGKYEVEDGWLVKIG